LTSQNILINYFTNYELSHQFEKRKKKKKVVVPLAAFKLKSSFSLEHLTISFFPSTLNVWQGLIGTLFLAQMKQN
jgi:hypothetical protein